MESFDILFGVKQRCKSTEQSVEFLVIWDQDPLCENG